MTLFKTKPRGGKKKALHVPSEAEPGSTACSAARPTRALHIRDLVPVSLSLESWEATAHADLCKACLRARPAIFPDHLVEAAFPSTARPGALAKAPPPK